MVVMDERDKRPFSMASTPFQQDFIELHIGASELNLYAMAVMDRILKEKNWMLIFLMEMPGSVKGASVRWF